MRVVKDVLTGADEALMVTAGWPVAVVVVLASAADGPVVTEDAEPLTAKESVVLGCVGVGAGACVEVEDGNGGDDASELVEPRAKVSCMLFLEVDAATPGVAAELDTKGKVSPLLPELVWAGLEAGATAIDSKVDEEVVVGWLDVPLAKVELDVPLEFAAGRDGNAVNGGEAPGSFGTAGTSPTIPDGLTGKPD
jgi:hypothetical protein